MQELDNFKAQLKTIWSPTIAVIASDEAESLCLERNGLTVAELLRPFGALRKMNGGMGGERRMDIGQHQYFSKPLNLLVKLLRLTSPLAVYILSSMQFPFEPLLNSLSVSTIGHFIFTIYQR
jgi:hypothetical protein